MANKIQIDDMVTVGALADLLLIPVTKLIGELFKNTPNLRMKIVAFGDYCDMQSASNFRKAKAIC
jgi:hypothetical protein